MVQHVRVAYELRRVREHTAARGVIPVVMSVDDVPNGNVETCVELILEPDREVRGERIGDDDAIRRDEEDGAMEIAGRSRGTPRIAGRLLRRVRDFADVAKADVVDAKIADAALTRLEVDGRGLDAMDRRYLRCIAEGFGGGPVGIETIAASLSEPRDAVEDIIEPYLLQQALIQRTPRGRVLTDAALKHLGLAISKKPDDPQLSLPTDDKDGDV